MLAFSSFYFLPVCESQAKSHTAPFEVLEPRVSTYPTTQAGWQQALCEPRHLPEGPNLATEEPQPAQQHSRASLPCPAAAPSTTLLPAAPPAHLHSWRVGIK